MSLIKIAAHQLHCFWHLIWLCWGFVFFSNLWTTAPECLRWCVSPTVLRRTTHICINMFWGCWRGALFFRAIAPPNVCASWHYRKPYIFFNNPWLQHYNSAPCKSGCVYVFVVFLWVVVYHMMVSSLAFVSAAVQFPALCTQYQDYISSTQWAQSGLRITFTNWFTDKLKLTMTTARPGKKGLWYLG